MIITDVLFELVLVVIFVITTDVLPTTSTSNLVQDFYSTILPTSSSVYDTDV